MFKVFGEDRDRAAVKVVFTGDGDWYLRWELMEAGDEAEQTSQATNASYRRR